MRNQVRASLRRLLLFQRVANGLKQTQAPDFVPFRSAFSICLPVNLATLTGQFASGSTAMSDAQSRRSWTNLAVLAFDQFQTNPARRHGFAEAMGGSRGGNSGCGSKIHARHGSAFRPWMTTPRSSARSASLVGTRSTCAQYSRSWAWRGCSRRWFDSGSSLSNNNPSESASSRPMG